MKFHKTEKHTIDFLFPISLFLVFAASSVIVILLAVHVYEGITKQASYTYQSRTALAYISEKIHQNDDLGRVYLETFENCDALVLEQSYQEQAYYTYIYYYDGSLRELFFKKGTDVSLDNGKSILSLQAFSMEEINGELFSFSCTDNSGQSASCYIHIHNQKE